MSQTDDELLAQSATQLAQWGNFEAAVVAFRQAIELNPHNAETRYNLALLLKGLGRSDDAIAQYQEAIRLDPNFAKAYNRPVAL